MIRRLVIATAAPQARLLLDSLASIAPTLGDLANLLTTTPERTTR